MESTTVLHILFIFRKKFAGEFGGRGIVDVDVDVACRGLNFCALFGVRASYVGTITDDFICSCETCNELFDFGGINCIDLFGISPVGNLKSVRSYNVMLL
jgi:hypothetical protein